MFTNEEARTLALEKFQGELQRTSSSKMAVKKAASSLAKAALAKGSRDNVTVVVVDVRLPGQSSGHNGAGPHAHGTSTPRHAAPASGALPPAGEQHQQQSPQTQQQQLPQTTQHQSPQTLQQPLASPATPVASDDD